MSAGRIGIVCWLCWCAIQTAGYVPVWRAELPLWTHGERIAPWLPRTKINLGKAMIAAGFRQQGRAVALTGYELERRRQDAVLADRARPR